MKKALAFVLTITMLFAFCTGMAEGWTAIEPNTGGESTQAEGGTGGEGAFTADDGYTEPERYTARATRTTNPRCLRS